MFQTRKISFHKKYLAFRDAARTLQSIADSPREERLLRQCQIAGFLHGHLSIRKQGSDTKRVFTERRATRGLRRIMRSSPPRNGEHPRMLLGKGSISCRACTRDDNDRAGDTVRTCRDYVIGPSGNVAAMIMLLCRIRLPASDQHRDTCKSVIGSAYSPLASSRPRRVALRALIGNIYFNCVIHSDAP